MYTPQCIYNSLLIRLIEMHVPYFLPFIESYSKVKYMYSCLPQQFAGRHVAPLGHIIMISANQSLLLLLFVFLGKTIHDVCFIEIKEQLR